MTWALILEQLERLAEVVVFLLTVTVVAELSGRAGVFDVAGHWMVRRGRGRLGLLWLLFAGFCVAATAFLSLDTTAVLLTPVALAIARHVGAPPRAFALTTLWIANTGSLLLPVSNLTNLLAVGRFASLGVGHLDYIRLALGPGLASIAVTLALIVALHPRLLTVRYDAVPAPAVRDAVLVRVGWSSAR